MTVSVDDEQLTLSLEDGRVMSVPLSWYPRLSYGSLQERQHFQISGAGFGTHWPDLDEDIGVEGILLGKKSMESPNSFQTWLEEWKGEKP
ncbi:DUF2442 domain-containing protein [Synechocystis salina LEGE 06155]|nr:DUF2442 domain-containing protein [Synechocystis salina LEGE 06155]